jgi:DNA topoisomerase-1
MIAARLESTQLHIGPANKVKALTYVARGTRVVFPGFLKVYDESLDEKPEPGEDTGEQLLPLVHKDDSVTMQENEAKQHFTQPPPRYTEASLVKEMEKLGIGRPSTYAPTIATIQERSIF